MKNPHHLPRLRSLRRKFRPLEGLSSEEFGYYFGPDPKFFEAVLQPQALAPGERAITYYWHVSHLGPAYAAQVFGHDRDAAYMLDEIFKIRSELPILEHFTDTHGSTLVTFALAYLFGVEFLPRIKQIHDTRLYFPPGMEVEGPLRAHFEGPVDVELIKRHWDDVLRILASVQAGDNMRLAGQIQFSYLAGTPIRSPMNPGRKVFRSKKSKP